MKEMTAEESTTYRLIMERGSMDDMFDFGYVLGEKHILKQQLKRANDKYELDKKMVV